jgi:hypothetical protein
MAVDEPLDFRAAVILLVEHELRADGRMAARYEGRTPGRVRGLVRCVCVLPGRGEAAVRANRRRGERLWGLRKRDQESVVQHVQVGRAERLSVRGYLQRSGLQRNRNVAGTTVETGSLSTCQPSVSGYAGVYDLSGNVWEWEDSVHVGGARDPSTTPSRP